MAILYDGIGNKIETGGAETTVEPMDNDIPCVYIDGILPIEKSQVELNVVIRYASRTLTHEWYATAKVQGDSSAGYPKKNYTIKLYTDLSRSIKSKHGFRNWGKTNKFVLKANWIDHSHARNVVSARLWTEVVKSRSDFDSLPNELVSGNMAVDGFPVKVFNNGVYLGIYTWNLPKDALYGLDDEINENCIMQGDNGSYPDSEMFRGTTVSGVWSDELHDSMPSAISTAWTNILTFVSTASDSDFVANFETHFDKQSIIDVLIFTWVACVIDNLGKNQTYFTYDAQKWYGGMYDLDGTWGLPPVPSSTRTWYDATAKFQDDYEAVVKSGKTNLLFERVLNLFSADVKTRYTELRSSVLSENKICGAFEEFTQVIPVSLYVEEYAETTGDGAFTEIPLVDTNNIQQIRQFIVNRLAYVDAEMKAMVPSETTE